MIRSIVPVKIRERCREDQTVGILEKRYIQHYKQYVLYLFFALREENIGEMLPNTWMFLRDLGEANLMTDAT